MKGILFRLRAFRQSLSIFLKSITFRLLVFNLLLAIFPVGAFLFLGTYEKQLLDSQERAMVQQGRILAASLSGENLAVEAREALARLGNRNDARLRVLNAMGQLMADSARIPQSDEGSSEVDIAGQPLAQTGIPVVDEADAANNLTNETSYPEESVIYRIGAIIPRVFRRLTGYFRPPTQPGEDAEYYIGKEFLDGPEVMAALEEGRYGAATRISQGQVSVTLYSAIPIVRNEDGYWSSPGFTFHLCHLKQSVPASSGYYDNLFVRCMRGNHTFHIAGQSDYRSGWPSAEPGGKPAG